MLLTVLNYLYLCVWATLLVHCLKNSRLYPLFDNGWGTKGFWLFTFVFLNPILSLLYILCVFCPLVLNWKNKRFKKYNKSQIIENLQKRNKVIPAVVLITTCITLVLFEIPRNNTGAEPVTILNKFDEAASNQNSPLKSGLNIGFINAKNTIQTISSNSAKNDMKVDFRNIMLICKSNNPLLELVALHIQKSLIKFPYINSVSCRSNIQLSEPNDVTSDFFITLEMTEQIESKFFLNREMQVKIKCFASSSFLDVLSESCNNISSESIVSFTIKSQLQHTSRTLCVECPGTEYEHEVKNISHELTEAFKKQFDNVMNKSDMNSETIYSNDM